MTRVTRRARLMLLSVGMGAASLMGGALVVRADQSVPETMTEFAFDQSAVTVPVGQTAHFNLANAGRFPHTMTIEDAPGVAVLAAPDPLAAGETGTLDAVFSAPGTYQFWCPVANHKDLGMVGTITVVAAAAPTPTTAPAAPAATPAPAATSTTPAPRARDGQSLDTQSAATRTAFIAVWGNQAGAEWVKEHQAALSSQGH